LSPLPPPPHRVAAVTAAATALSSSKHYRQRCYLAHVAIVIITNIITRKLSLVAASTTSLG
jgi:hypothetical protein